MGAVPRAASRHFCTEHTPSEVEPGGGVDAGVSCTVLVLAGLAGDGLVGSFPSLVSCLPVACLLEFPPSASTSLSYPPHPPLYPSTTIKYHPSSPGTTVQVLQS